MQTQQIRIAHELWTITPINRPINPLTGLIEGDDSGYRRIRTLPANESPLVVPAVEIRPSYEGIDEYGKSGPSIALPGGLPNGQTVVRECVARDLEDADRLLTTVFGGALRICVLDGFRSWRRQAAGFSRMLHMHLAACGLKPEEFEDAIAAFLQAAVLADGTFSWVNAATDTAEYATVVEEIRQNPRVFSQLEAYTASLGPTGTMEDALYQYITVSANSGLGSAAGRVPLDFEGNAHAGGGAVDMMLIDEKGRPISLVPFDYPGEEASMDYAEKDENLDKYLAHANADAPLGRLLRGHLEKLGFATPAQFTRNDWEYFRDVNRIRYHLGKSKGWTYYSSVYGSENWHFEPGNIGIDARTGKVIHAETATAQSLPNSGNPGHTLQTLGRTATAVWGGSSGHRQARKLGLEG